MKILLLSKYSRMGASSRLRTLQYLPYLQAQGFEITVHPLFDDDYLRQLYGERRRTTLKVATAYLKRAATLLQARRYDLLWLEKESLPYIPHFVEAGLVGKGTPYVVDYDDAIFHHYDLTSNPVKKALLGDKIDQVMRHAACVVTGNEYLAARARSAGARKVVVVPTVVDHTRYAMQPAAAGAPPTIGWIGSPSTQVYVADLAEPLARVCSAYGARLLLVGARPDIAKAFAGLEVEVAPWSEQTEAGLIARMDIGIMPLRDGPWEKGKCGYKIIQYMACGIPVVASAIGANIDIIEGSRSGLLARSPQDWERALSQLLGSPQQRADMGRQGRSSVQHTYSLQAQSATQARVLQDAGRRP